MNKKRLNLYALIIPLFLITGFFCVAVNSKNSFLYSFNDSFDVHCFVTTAKAMLRGDILYRDIYEQKGPMLYFIYMIGLRITDSSFLGVYLIESLFFSVFILFVFKTAKLYIDKDLPCTVIAIITAVISSSTKCFLAGGQCEELSLPFLAVTLYLVLRYFKKDYPNRISAFHIIIIGICFSVLFWMKYVMVGLFIGLVLAIIILQIKNKKPGYIFLYAFEFLIGFAIGSLPVIIYFYRHNAFGELWECYFYNLIFKYGGGSSNKSSLLKVFSSSAFYRRYFGVSFAVSAAAAYILFSSEKHMKNPEKLASILMMIFEAMGIGMSIEWDYSAECMFAFAVLGFVGIYLLIADCKTDLNSLIKKASLFVHNAFSTDISKNAVFIAVVFLILFISGKTVFVTAIQVGIIYSLLKFLSSVSSKSTENRKRILIIKYVSLYFIFVISIFLRTFILLKIILISAICTILDDLYVTETLTGINSLRFNRKKDIYSLLRKFSLFIHQTISTSVPKNTLIFAAAVMLIISNKNLIINVLQTSAIYFLVKFLFSVSTKKSKNHRFTLIIKYTLLAALCLISLILNVFAIFKVLLITIICTALDDLYVTESFENTEQLGTDWEKEICLLIKKLVAFIHTTFSAGISKNTVILTVAIMLILMNNYILQAVAIYFLLKFLSSVSNKNSETRKRTLTIKYTLLAVICLISLILRIFILSKILIVTIICTALEDLYATDFKAISKLRGKYSKKRITSFCGFGFAVVMIISAFSMSTSSYDIGTDISTFPQYQISEHIKNSGKEKPSIILYNMLDPGVYWLSGNEPVNKFFCSYNNKNLEEVKDLYSEYIYGGKADFIISISPIMVNGYKEVYHDFYDYRYAGNIRDFYLYEKID